MKGDGRLTRGERFASFQFPVFRKKSGSEDWRADEAESSRSKLRRALAQASLSTPGVKTAVCAVKTAQRRVKRLQGLVKTLPAVRKMEASGVKTDPRIVKTLPSMVKTFPRREFFVPYALKTLPHMVKTFPA